MAEVYSENSLVLKFYESSEINEPKVIRQIFKKFEQIASKPGFKKDFTPTEIDMIKGISNNINTTKESESSIQVL